MSEIKPQGKKKNVTKGIARQWLAQKRAEALERQAAYDKKSVQQVLADLSTGNYRAERQRRKLAARLAKEQSDSKKTKKQ